VVYIIEDDINIRELESYALRRSGFETREFDSPAEFFRAVNDVLPSLVLLDLMLPGADGLGVLANLKSDRRTRSLPVIIVSAKTKELDRVKGLDIGADDYITKPFSIAELVSRVRAVLRRTRHYTGEDAVIIFSGLRLDIARREVFVDGEPLTLTYTEFELLLLLSRFPGTVLSRVQILGEVWGGEYDAETRTVDMHVTSLRRKLGLRGRLIITVRGVGYMLKEQE